MWKKLVEREGTFLKNKLLYESYNEEFVSVYGVPHCNFLTVREGDTFTHYLDSEDIGRINKFIQLSLEDDSNFLLEKVNTGKEHFTYLITFCENLPNLNTLRDEELQRLAKNYFFLYKKPYPYFQISVFAEGLDEDNVKLLAEWRLFSRQSFNKAHTLIEPLFNEIALRMGISIEELGFLTPDEVVSFNILDENRNLCYFVLENGDVKFNLGKFLLEEKGSKIVQGRGTFPAVAEGRVRLVLNHDDVSRIKPGEILVFRMITPSLLLNSIEKASAIITDEGGITSHPAILSREYNVPALLGTGNASRILKTGDYVELDTGKGRLILN